MTAAPVAGEFTEWSPPPPAEVHRRLVNHLHAWLGVWPPRDYFQVVGAPQRDLPGWDGEIHPVVGVAAPEGTVVSVPPEIAERVQGSTLEEVSSKLATILGPPGGRLVEAAFRWSEKPADLAPVGIWLPVGDPRLPEWLKPFGGEALVALDEVGRYAAGVGIKRHDRFGQEIAVGTEPAHRGHGLARRLVAEAARAILESGSVPTYLHELANVASARVAEAAGFPDRGWRVLGFWDD